MVSKSCDGLPNIRPISHLKKIMKSQMTVLLPRPLPEGNWNAGHSIQHNSRQILRTSRKRKTPCSNRALLGHSIMAMGFGHSGLIFYFLISCGLIFTSNYCNSFFFMMGNNTLFFWTTSEDW